ncbi:MAG: nitroreductase [Chitinophagales bacterium]|nr:nitroreductase [Hyphomicrobiales bacterium]
MVAGLQVVNTQDYDADAITNEAVLKHLLTRRSVSANSLLAPGPSASELDIMLAAAARVPDHKKLAPWRFIVFEGDARARFGETLAAICAADEPEVSHARLEMERNRFTRAPLVVAVIARHTPHPAAPEWEQTLSAGAVCLNLLHAAVALGYAGNWITEWCAYNANVYHALGLAENERVAGFIYIGTAKDKPADRERPDLAAIVTRWTGA